MGRPRGTPPVFDQQAFVVAMGAADAVIAQAIAVKPEKIRNFQ